MTPVHGKYSYMLHVTQSETVVNVKLTTTEHCLVFLCFKKYA